MLALVLGVSSRMLESAFRAIEDREFAETRARMEKVVAMRLEQMDWKARDWAEWDAAAEWLATGRGSFARENLNDSALPVLAEGFLAYWTRDGRLAGALSSDLATHTPLPVDTSCIRQILSDSSSPATSGIHRCRDGLRVASLRPVRPSLDGSVSPGWLVMGHPFDAMELAVLSGLFGEPLRLVDDSSAEPDLEGATAHLRIRVPVRGGGPLWIEAEVARPVREVWGRMRRPLGWGLLAIALGGAALFLWLLETFVVRRIVRLSADVVEFDHEGGVRTAPFGDGGSDEISSLGQAMDGLVARLVGVQEHLARALDAAQDAARTKSAFLASVSHDLRTPLNGMIGLADYVQRTPMDDGQREAMDLLRGAAENLLTMINDVLEFSRQEAGFVELQPEDVATEEVFHSSLKVLAPIAHHQGIDLDVELDPDLPSQLRIDAARMRQILHNLVGNALKFTERGGVSVSVRGVGRVPDGIRLRVEVRDSGPGIRADLIEAIFEPFVQVGTGVSRQAGTGLGLPIARRLVSQMGGALGVESEVGKGSLFHFEIDAEVPLQARRLVPLRIPASGSGRVAILLRGARTRRSLVELLEGLDLSVLEIWSPGDLGTLAGAQDLRLVIADSESLGPGELEGLADLRRQPGLQTIPVIVLSRSDRLGDDALCREMGVQTVLRRPVAPTVLLNALDRELHPRRKVLVLATNPFLRAMLSGILQARGHLVRFQGESGEEDPGTDPEVCLLDGESPGFATQWSDLARRFPQAERIQLGGTAATTAATFLSRPFTAQQLCALVEREAGRRKVRSVAG